MTPDDLHILYAALLALLHGDTEPWDNLTIEDVDGATDMLARVASILRVDGDDDDDEDDDDDGAGGYDYH